MSGHGDESDGGSVEVNERAPAPMGTVRVRSVARTAAAVTAGAIVAKALDGRPSASGLALAKRLDVGHSRALALLRCEAPIYVGDLLLMTAGDALAVLDALRAHVVERAPAMPIDKRLRRITRNVGQLANAIDEALLDGKVDAQEQHVLDAHLLAVAGESLSGVGS